MAKELSLTDFITKKEFAKHQKQLTKIINKLSKDLEKLKKSKKKKVLID